MKELSKLIEKHKGVYSEGEVDADFHMSIYSEDGKFYVFIVNSDSYGYTKEVHNTDDVGEAVKFYLESQI